MAPETLNLLLVLRCNRELWDIKSLVNVFENEDN
jgi:hypothetical protein